MNELKRDFTKLRIEAEKLGFVELDGSNGFFKHPLLDWTFDFTATDPNKLILAVWLKAVEHGKTLKARAITQELNIFDIGMNS